MTIIKYINNHIQNDNTIYNILGEKTADPTVFGYTGNSEIREYRFEDLEIGMQVKSNDDFYRIKSLKITNTEIDLRPTYYFLHIKKASGISLQKEMRKSFKNSQIFINPIIYLNDDLMLNSKFISGHFSRYPIDLFKANNKKLKTISLFRNPVDRLISQFNYEYYFNNWEKNTFEIPRFENFLNYLYDGQYMKNLQAMSICSNINIIDSERFTNGFLNDMVSASTLFKKIAQNGFMHSSGYLDNCIDIVNEFDLAGTIDNRDKFLNKLSNLLTKDGYHSDIKNPVWNKTFIDTSSFKKQLAPEDINKIISDNSYDFKIYEHLLVKGL